MELQTGIPGIAVWGRFQGIPGTVPNRYPRPLSRDRGSSRPPIPGIGVWTLSQGPGIGLQTGSPGPSKPGLPGPWFGAPNQGPGKPVWSSVWSSKPSSKPSFPDPGLDLQTRVLEPSKVAKPTFEHFWQKCQNGTFRVLRSNYLLEIDPKTRLLAKFHFSAVYSGNREKCSKTCFGAPNRLPQG